MSFMDTRAVGMDLSPSWEENLWRPGQQPGHRRPGQGLGHLTPVKGTGVNCRDMEAGGGSKVAATGGGPRGAATLPATGAIYHFIQLSAGLRPEPIEGILSITELGYIDA